VTSAWRSCPILRKLDRVVSVAETDETRPQTGGELKAFQDQERCGKFLYWRDRSTGEFQMLGLTENMTRVTVGRSADRDVLLRDDEVSRLHAVLEPVGDEWVLVDDGLSRNGSYVNRTRVSGRQLLHDADRMCFGRSYVSYRDPTSEPPSKTTARAEKSQVGVRVQGTKRKVLIALCRPVIVGGSTTPATNPQIAAELYLAVQGVKTHMRELFEWFGLSELPQNEKRAMLVQIVRENGLIEPWEF
jgi:hypothetical protein